MKKVILVLAVLAFMAGSAYAAEWNFYGSARLGTFWSDIDEISGTDGNTQYSEYLQVNSRIGAKVKVSDELTGRFEYGAGGNPATANIRLLYGEWNFGAGKLLVGQDYGPLSWLWSNQVYGHDNDLLAQGAVYSHRHPQIRLTFGDFKIAFLDPQKDITNGTESQTIIPAIEMAYTLDLDVISLDFGVGYSTFEATDNVVGNEEDVESYLFALGAQFDMAGFFMKGDVYYGENAGNLIWISVDGDRAIDDGFAEFDATGKLLDNECIGFMLVAGYKINDTFTVEAGYGYTQTELDDNDDDESATYYINTTINLAPGVFVVPEVGFFDGKEDLDTEIFYYGMKWQINF